MAGLGGFAALVLLLVKRGDEASATVGRVLGRLPLINPASIERFVRRVAERLKELAADRDLLRRMGTAARRRVDEQFRLADSLEAFAGVFHEVIES